MATTIARRCFRIASSSINRAVSDAVRKAGLTKPVSPHTLRHCLATYLLLQGTDIRQVQEYMGHVNVETKMIYTHVVRELSPQADSPLDRLMVEIGDNKRQRWAGGAAIPETARSLKLASTAA